MLVGAGKLVEQGGLAAVLVARQRKGEHRAVRQGMFALFGVVASALAKAGVLHHPAFFPGRGLCRGFRRFHRDLRRIIQAQRQLIAMDLQLHGVAHGCKLHQRDLLAGDQAHIQKMLAERTRSAHRADHCAFADLQFF